MAVSTIKNPKVYPTSYLTEGLTYTDCEYKSGGYFIIGNMLVLNLRITIAKASNTSKVYVGLSSSIRPKQGITVILTAANGSDDLAPTFAVCTSTEGIVLNNTTVEKDFIISGMWLLR